MQTFKLNNGYELPVVGIGTNTFGKQGGNFEAAITMDTTELQTAIAAGYRLIDTAIMYRNEAVIGKAVRESEIDRADFFITSKIPNREEWIRDADTIQAAVDFSLKELGMEYLDLYLIHHPMENLADILRVWRVLEANVEAGKIRSIGVSNFSNEQLGYLLSNAKIKPVLNQIESHPDGWNDEIIEYCLANNVIPQAWAPLKRIGDDSMEKIKIIAEHHGKTWAQVILNYQINRGVNVIPKSHNAERQKENLDIFNFELTEDEKQILRTCV